MKNIFFKCSVFAFNVVLLASCNDGDINQDSPKDQSGIQCEKGEACVVWHGKDITLRFLDFGTDTAFVSFYGWATEERGYDTPGLSENFFKKKKISAIFIINRKNHWYQTGEIYNVLPLIKRQLKKYRKSVLFGSSMGGFAALAFSRELEPDKVLVFGPQVILEKWPYFSGTQKELSFDVIFSLGNALSKKSEYFIFYAHKHDHDRNAVEVDLEKIRVGLNIDKYHAYPLPLNEHSLMPLLLKAGYLETINMAVAEGDHEKLKLLFQPNGEAWNKLIEIEKGPN